MGEVKMPPPSPVNHLMASRSKVIRVSVLHFRRFRLYEGGLVFVPPPPFCWEIEGGARHLAPWRRISQLITSCLSWGFQLQHSCRETDRQTQTERQTDWMADWLTVWLTPEGMWDSYIFRCVCVRLCVSVCLYICLRKFIHLSVHVLDAHIYLCVCLTIFLYD